ncbi:MAG: DUF86 domain-containing protein [Candidatus Sabulitectum sp.]|nr:DUF86 domain-containing protein [Candidatus Sabulitectum sp.]
MLPEDRDKALILDIISAGEDIISFIEGSDFRQFSESKLLRYAVERQLLVIGEAALRLSRSFKDNVSEIPWEAIVGLRNIIAHDYGEVLTERIWLVASRDLNQLLKALQPFSDFQ